MHEGKGGRKHHKQVQNTRAPADCKMFQEMCLEVIIDHCCHLKHLFNNQKNTWHERLGLEQESS
jgi:hypothetical protein